MNELEFIKWAVVGLMSLGVWFMKRTLDRVENDVEDCKKEISKIRQDELQLIRQEYLHKNDFREFKSELRNMFEEIKTDIRSLSKPH